MHQHFVLIIVCVCACLFITLLSFRNCVVFDSARFGPRFQTQLSVSV